nr:IS30 family transposase [Macrococcus carouselicus]
MESRPEVVDAHTTFGHWEIDTVIGQKSEKDQVLLTLVERKSRYEIVMKIDGKQRRHVDKAVSELIEEIGDSFPRVFKSITSANGSEFSGLSG